MQILAQSLKAEIIDAINETYFQITLPSKENQILNFTFVEKNGTTNKLLIQLHFPNPARISTNEVKKSKFN